MNIDRVRVQGLFGDFDHELAFGDDERIMILIGPNGFGKTTTLKLIDTLFNQPLGRLATLPFRRIEVSFNDGTILIATRETNGGTRHRSLPRLTLTCDPHGTGTPFPVPTTQLDPKHLPFPLSAIEDFIPVLTRLGSRTWYDTETGSTLELDEVLASFGDQFPPDFTPVAYDLPEWLQGIRSSVAIRFIDTERLTRNARQWRHRRPVPPTRTVSYYSKELATRIGKSIESYGSLSQDLDRTFPARLVADGNHPNASIGDLRKELAAIEQKRSRLEEAGLLAGHRSGLDIPDLREVEDSQLGVLAVYAQDAREKLGVFDKLYKKVNAFTRIANARFRHKTVAVNNNGLMVVKSDGTALDLEKLSSGEQHELVMLYELLFRAFANSLILIDEPELSLHVAWQEQWLKDLEDIAALSDFRAIVATHSPEIIGDRWGLTVELRGPSSD